MRLLLAAVLACTWACASAGLALAEVQPGTITTGATARMRLPNTIADVGVGIEAHGRTVAAVHKNLADGSGALLGYLRGAGAERLRTDQIAVTPDTETDRGGGRPDRIVGYTGHVRVSFRVAADKLADVLGGLLEKGGNTLEATLLGPREEEVEKARQELATRAVRTAMAQAQAVAEAAGRRVGAVRQINVDPGFGLPQRPPMFAAASRAAMAAPIATEAGESEVASSVSVTVNLIEP